MKYLLYVLSFVFLISFAVFGSSAVFDGQDEEGFIVLSTFSSVSGYTLVDSCVSINDTSLIVGEDCYFEISNLSKGDYILSITKEGYSPCIIYVTVSDNESVFLGTISLSDTDPSMSLEFSFVDGMLSPLVEEDVFVLDVSDPDYLDYVFLHDDPKEPLFSFGRFNISADLSFLDIYYSRNIDSFNSSFSSSGLLISLTFKESLIVKDIPFFLSLDLDFLNGVQGHEKVYEDNVFSTYLMSGMDFTSYGLNLGYEHSFSNYFDAYFFLGKSYDFMDLDFTTFDSNTFHSFGKQYFSGDGFSLGAGFSSDLSSFALPDFLSPFSLGVDYSHVGSTFSISSTDDFVSVSVPGSKNVFDFWVGYCRDNFDFMCGYKSISINTDSKVEGQYVWPLFDSDFTGVYLKFDIPF